MMKAFFKYIIFLLPAFVILPLIGCSDDDDMGFYNQTDYSIVGEWYEDFGNPTGKIQEIFISKYNKDGTSSGLSAIATTTDWNYLTIEGTYRINGKKLYSTDNIFGENILGTYDIQLISKYDLILSYSEGERIDLSHRIVDTYYLNVGDKEELFFNDPDFIPLEYSSNDESIAKVDEDGFIEAVRSGTAYISAKSKTGTAVVRIVVTNATTGIDNFLTYLGEKINTATNAYGNLYLNTTYNNDSSHIARHYFLVDDKVGEVLFIYGVSDIVDEIRFAIRDSTTFSELLDTYNRLYEFRAEYQGRHYFETTKDARPVTIEADLANKIIMMSFENDPIAIVDELVYMTATEAAAKIGHEITEEEKVNGEFTEIISHKYFRGITIFFNPETDIITRCFLYANKDISYEDIDGWYARHYMATGDEINKYGYVDPHTLSAIYIRITVNDENGNIAVVYQRF